MAEDTYVWIWLPGHTEPVVAGLLAEVPTGGAAEERYYFRYGRTYLEREDRIPIFTDLPLSSGTQEPPAGLQIAGSLLDATPDSWGRRVVNERVLGHRSRDSDPADLGLLTYMLQSGSDRIGALDFQSSATNYVPRDSEPADLDTLLDASELLERGETLPQSLSDALALGTSVGGARPKALVADGDTHYIAKFASVTDSVSVVHAEAAAMELARRVGIRTANTKVVSSNGRPVLLVERFDRLPGGRRRAMVSALTILQKRPEAVRGATYPDLVEQIRKQFTEPAEAIKELYKRVVFNVVVRNTDDHARNHAAFWDGRTLSLTPAYDISPTIASRPDTDVTHPMAFTADGDRRSRLSVLRTAAQDFGISKAEADSIIDYQIDVVKRQFDDVADMVGMPSSLKQFLLGRQVLNQAIFWEE
jgi:serine/threonine-protein kinase HipA